MREFDIFVPLCQQNGRPIPKSLVLGLKRQLLHRFGGITYFPQRNEGLWKVGNYTFRDKIVIFRVIASGKPATLAVFRKFKRKMERELNQQDVLIISRAIKII